MSAVKSIQNYAFPREEVQMVITAMQDAKTLPSSIRVKYRHFRLDPSGQLVYDGRTLVPTEEQDRVIEEAYNKTFAGINRLHAYLMARYLGVKQSSVAAWLARSGVQQQHRHQRLLGSTKPRVVKDLNAVWQIDLMHFRDVPVLVVVDLWSKFCRLAMLPNREAKAVANAMETMFSTGRPRAISSDNGGEFRGDFSAMLETQAIPQIFGQPGQPTSQASAERFVRTVRMALERYLTSGGKNWRGFLVEWAETFNDIKHLSTGFTPRSLQNASEDVKQIVAARREAQVTKLLAKRRQIPYPPLCVGDLVRTRIRRKNPLEKRTLPEYSEEVYSVTQLMQTKYRWPQFKLSSRRVYGRDQLLKIPRDTQHPPARTPNLPAPEERKKSQRARTIPVRYRNHKTELAE
eukprot:Lithocolla_globosa_v1_NODE_6_length_11976_cov_15.425432.p3 type:complete len:404 gc:universal NODE_6_length_11976_cov_15.425432:5878-4667(-)